jgi:hypothetical protein
MSSETPDYFEAYSAGYQAALEADYEEKQQYTPTPEYEGAPTVNIGGMEYSNDAALIAAAQMQVAARLDAQAAQAAAVANKAVADEVFAALEEKHGASFRRDQKPFGEWLARNPGFLSEGDAQTMAEQMDTALEFWRAHEAEQQVEAKRVADEAYGNELIAAHKTPYGHR